MNIRHTHRLELRGDTVRKRYVSWDRGEAEREWLALTTLAPQAPDLVPRPIGREVEEGAPVVVMSRLPGRALGAEPLSTAQTGALADAYRTLFAVPVSPDLPERAYGPSTMRAEVRAWAAKDYDLAPCREPTYVEAALDAVREWLAADDPVHVRVLEPVPARGDGNLANVMWDGTRCRLIDFEEFGVSDPAYEVADVLEHAASRYPLRLPGDELLRALEFGPERLARTLAYRQLFAAFWLVMMLPGNGGFRRNPAGTTERQAARFLSLTG